MLSPDESEIGLLSSLQKPQDITFVMREGVSTKSFLSYGAVYEHILAYTKEYGNVPKHEDLTSEFSPFKMKEPGDLGFYVSEVLKHEMIRGANSAVIEYFGPANSRLEANPEETIRGLAETLRKLRRTSASHISWLDKDAMERLAWFQEKRELAKDNKVLGIPTGLKCFDGSMQGWGPGEAIMVMSPKGVGKSWLLMYFAVHGYNNGYKILFLSPEMSTQECALRFDVVLAYQKGIQLSHQNLTIGGGDEAVYEEWLKELTMRERFIVIDSPGSDGFTTANVLNLMDEYKPDILLMDGLHLIGSEEKLSGWEKIKQASDSMKAAAQFHKCTVIWASQVDREAMRNPTEPASTGASAAYGKAAVEAANRLITLGTYDGDSRRRTFKIPNNRSGREFHDTQHLMFDVDIGAIYQLESSAPMKDGEEIF